MGFNAHFVRFPENDFSIVAFGNLSTNRAWGKISRILPRIADMYLAEAIETDEAVDAEWNDHVPFVELSEIEVKKIASQVGFYRIRHGAFGRLEIRDQQLLLLELSEPHNPKNEPITLTPVGPSRFRTNRGYDDIDLVFEQQDGSDRPTVSIEYSYGAKQKWEPVEFVTLDDEQLADYLGEYRCDDMESVYRISVENSKLFIHFNFSRKRELLQTLPDLFILTKERFNGMLFTFSRDPSRAITGFDLEFGRVKSLRFEQC